ncbi:baseplate J/gp47 family protein [Ruegeria sp. Ofav3-42]|uniref:baseplate J/gp47 family protein n=1 Tax=Ruegeria sp. Ofav3-42 TaxID=2917759 RepID=UPI001EF53303|nr:baseplate J/gp47 family protein [Ruegeria sp. Ofav3-42]MCG7518848.1 baseplate J/gp47 family protein [Ruegeria sp. Ofav3-42]
MPSDAPITVLNKAGAPGFVTVEAQKLLDQAKAKFEADTGRTLSEMQVEMHLLETIAYMLALRGAEEQLALQNCFIAWAQGDWLDRHGADRNTPRLTATAATTNLRFSTAQPAVARIQIPAGTRVGDAGGQVQFATSQPVALDVGQSSIDVPATAKKVGIGANGQPVGALTVLVDPVPGISAVTNLTETGGGSEREPDDRYRERLALAFERIGGGLNRERYRADVLGWNARCIDVHITRPQPGYVDIYPLMDTGAPNAQEITSLLGVFNDSNTHQGDFIQVKAPAPDAFTANLTLVLSTPTAEAPATAAVQNVLDEWTRSLGGYIAPSALIDAARDVTGVVDASVPGLAFKEVAASSWRKCTTLNVTVEAV